jgi:hypothetical protein
VPNFPLPTVAWYVASAEWIVLSVAIEAPSLAAILDARRLGIAIAAMMPIGTTITTARTFVMSPAIAIP